MSFLLRRHSGAALLLGVLATNMAGADTLAIDASAATPAPRAAALRMGSAVAPMATSWAPTRAT